MSGDVQPRKRKEKRRKKEDSEEIPTSFASDEQLHVHKDASTGGNICAKILFFILSFVLLVTIGLVVFEYRGSADDETLVPVSKWAATFDGWLETPVTHDEHADVTESGEQERGDNLGRSDEVIDKLPKIPGVNEKKIKAVSEEEADVPRRKWEKEVSETTQPVETTSKIADGQKPYEQHKSQDQGQAKLKTHQSSTSEKGVTEKPNVPKHEKPEPPHLQDRPASKSKHQTELPPVKNDGFPSGPGETGPSQKDDGVTGSKVTPSKKQKVGVETSKDSPPEATLSKKQKDDRGPAPKSEPLPADHSKPTVSGGKNVKDKDVSSDGVHSPPKASRIGDKIEHSPKVGKSGTAHKVIEQSSPTKLDENDRVSVSKSPHVAKSPEEHKKPVESKNKQGSESVHSASASGVKNSKLDTQHAQATTDDTVKIHDSKIDAHGKVGAAGNSASSDNKVKSASNVGVKQPTRESGNLNSQTKQEKKLGEKKKEDQASRKKENNVQSTSKLDHQAETVDRVATKDSSAAKLHEDPRKSKVGIEKQKASSQASAKTSGDGSSEVPEKVSTDKARKVSADNTKSRPPEKSAEVNAARKKSASDNAPPEDTHHSKPRDPKVSAVPEPTLKHSMKKEDDISKTQKVKPSVQSASSHKNSRDVVGRHTPTSENLAGHQENSGSKKPVNSDIKKPSHGQKVTSKRTENEVTQSESERSAERKAAPSQRDSDSETVGGEMKSSRLSQDKTVKEEEEEEEEGEDEPEPSGVPKTRKLQREEEDDDSGSDKEIPVTKSKIPKNMGGQNAQVYSKADITNEDDWHILQDLDRADDDVDENPEVAIHRYDTVLKSHPNSPRAWYGKATALDQLAAKKKSNFILDQAIDAYKKVTSELRNVRDKLFILAAERCIDRMRFRGVHARAVPIHKLLIARFPDDPAYQNQLAVTYLMINRNPEAKQVLENVLQKWPRNGFAQVHYGFILKTGNYNMTEAVRYLKEGIATREPGTIDGRFFFQLGDALMRLGRRKEAAEVNELGVKEGLFLSKYQRSLYNVDRLRAQPWWTPDETTYVPYFRKLEESWKQIKEEGVKALYDKNKNLFRDEAENLKDSGKWKQLELFARGRKVQTNCAKAPVTCKLIEEFPAARDCRRGQVKFSVMDPGTHVWPHCGPTNCRLRAHLGLVVPKNTFIRVADETRTWEEGKLFIFDDSFEHEVWHNGTTTRLVLIVDVWHPELTTEEKRTLPAI